MIFGFICYKTNTCHDFSRHIFKLCSRIIFIDNLNIIFIIIFIGRRGNFVSIFFYYSTNVYLKIREVKLSLLQEL